MTFVIQLITAIIFTSVIAEETLVVEEQFMAIQQWTPLIDLQTLTIKMSLN